MNNNIRLFQETVWDYYASHGRDLPWRHAEKNGNFDPYKIMVSEIMLQQTQVQRVIPKYTEFLKRFPTVTSLADARLSEVLGVWSGLGYNRRAKYLFVAAQEVVNRLRGVFPKKLEDLESLPGIGKNTAAAIRVYSYNKPEVFIETNIRTVFIHHFFLGIEKVSDRELLPLIEASLDKESPREWYWALMDYGTFIKKTEGNLSKQSSHYRQQSTFEGSRRQLRAQILRSLLGGAKTKVQLSELYDDERLDSVLDDLEREQLIAFMNKRFTLP